MLERQEDAGRMVNAGNDNVGVRVEVERRVRAVRRRRVEGIIVSRLGDFVLREEG